MKKIVLVLGLALACSTPARAIEIAISTQANWWSQAAADRETKLIVDSVKGATVKLFDATHQADLAIWVRDHTNDGRPDILMLCGRFPTSIYPANNAQPEGSLAELFLDAGNCIINTGDYLFYVVSSGTNNGTGGARNMMDSPNINMSYDNTPVTITADGKKYTPSLAITLSSRLFVFSQLNSDWYPELILAQNATGTMAEPVIMKNRVTGGRVGIFYQISGQDNLPRGKVISEWINNWYLPIVGGGGQALGPVLPAEKGTDVPRDSLLGWKAGQFAGTHDVYFGLTFADVNTASRTDKKGVLVSQGQADLTLQPAAPLEYGKTYYWRIDEVNKTPDNTIFKGNVWSFTVEPYGYPVTPTKATASSAQANMGPENTINNSGMKNDLHGNVETTMWLTTGAAPNWIQYEFDKVYKLHEMYVWNSNQQIEMMLGFGAKTVTIETSVDGTAWTAVKNVPEFAKAPGTADYAANTTVSMGEADAKFVKLTITANWGGLAPQTGLSEVRFSYTPTQARSPQPAQGSLGVAVDADFDWRPGREATSHKVLLGTDRLAVIGGTAPAQTVANHGFDPGAMNFGTSYYWRVDEIGAATYPGNVWAFTTQQYKPIDDFESYTDQPGKEVFTAWVDGMASTPKNGAIVGLYPDAVNGTFCERTIIHGGRQSMPFEYNNIKTPFYSEAERTFDQTQDWTGNGANTLSLWVRAWPVEFVDKGNGAFTVAASGHDIWDAADDFRFVYKQLDGDGSIVVKVDSLLNTNGWAKAGVMVRQNLTDGSPMVDNVISASNGVGLQYRLTTGANASSTNAPNTGGIAAPQWVKLTRKGNTFTAQYSADGQTWLDVKNPALTGTPVSITVSMTGPVYIGLCLTSHDRNLTTVAEFSGAATTGTVTGAWQQAWIGDDADRTNDPASLYVTVTDGAGKSVTVVHPDPAAANLNAWTEWKIALSDLKGVNLAKVKKLAIGVGDKASPKAGGAGKLYIDDVQFGGLPAPTAPLGLMAAYSFENNVKDSTANAYDGTVLGAPTFEAGKTGSALKLNGTTDCVDLGMWPAFNFPGSFSLSVWANIGAWTSNWNHVMVANRGESGIGWQLRRRDSNRIVFTTRGVGQDDEPRSTKDAPLNEWVHIAAVYDNAANTKRIYVNGVQDAFVATNPGKLAPTTHNTYIGARANSGNTGVEGRFTGMLDEVKIYDIALTPEEVLKLAGK